jgi:ATP-dependent protease Clp ATPase subunit
LRCSFCNKRPNGTTQLISSPSDHPRAYICTECIDVCYSIIKDSSSETEPAVENPRELTFDPLMVPELLEAVEHWNQRESAGLDSSAELNTIRRIAAVMFNTANRET